MVADTFAFHILCKLCPFHALWLDAITPHILSKCCRSFYRSVGWDIMQTSAQKNIRYYPCCHEPYPDVTFNITLKRKTLFYSINLIMPCLSITLLTILDFYLPSDAGEISLSISLLLSLSLFQASFCHCSPPRHPHLCTHTVKTSSNGIARIRLLSTY